MDAGGGGRVEGWTKRGEDSKSCVQRPPGQEFVASPRFTANFKFQQVIEPGKATLRPEVPGKATLRPE